MKRLIYPIMKIISLVWLAGVILSITASAFIYQTDIAEAFDVNSLRFAVCALLIIVGAACIAVAPYAIVEYHHSLEDIR